MPTVTLLPQIVRSVAYLYSPTVVMPLGIGEITIECPLLANQITNPLNRLAVGVEYLDTVGSVWRFYAGMTWQGGPGAPGNPRFTFSAAPLIGKTVRGFLDLPNSLRIGLKITY